jgi:hypothetical protein
MDVSCGSTDKAERKKGKIKGSAVIRIQICIEIGNFASIFSSSSYLEIGRYKMPFPKCGIYINSAVI